jgi:hypothetical protein
LFTGKANNIFDYSPGKTSGAIGPGEMALTMMGNPAQKADVGDIEVNGVKYEIKAGKISGGRLNSKAMAKATTGWAVWKENIESIVRTSKVSGVETHPFTNTRKDGTPYKVKHEQFSADQMNVSSSGGKEKLKEACKYNWNPLGFRKLNEEVLPFSNYTSTVNLFTKTIKTIVGNHEKIDEFFKKNNERSIDDLIKTAISQDGKSVQFKVMNGVYSKIAFLSYKLSEEQPWDAILFLNTTSLNYYIIRTADELVDAINNDELKVSGGFNWNDAQQTPTPTYNALA